MSHRIVKDCVAIAGHSNENLDLFSSNRRPDSSSDVSLKAGWDSLQETKVAKTGGDDLMPATDGEKHAHDLFVAPPEAPTGTQLRSVLAARKTTALKVRSVSTGRAASKSESSPSSRPTRSNSVTFPTISTRQTTARSSSALKKTTSASASSHRSPPSLPLNSALSVTRSSTPSSVRTQSQSSTPSSRTHSRSAILSVAKTRSAPNTRSSTPIPRPQRIANLAATSSYQPLTRTGESVTSRSSSGCLVSGARGNSGGRSFSSHDSPPRTPPRLKAKLSASLTSKETRTAANVTRGRSNGYASDRKASSGVSGKASGQSSAGDSSLSGRTISKFSLQMAIKYMDIQNGNAGRRPYSSTMLYPHSVRSSSSESKARRGAEKSSGEDEGRISLLAKVGKGDRYDSARYETLLFGRDVKDTNWLLSIDEPSSDSDQSLLFDNGFEPPPEPFPPL